VLRVLAASPAELAQLQAVWIIALVLDRGVGALLAVRALQGGDGRPALGRGHVSTASIYIKET